jgi:hypothetical protein
MCKASVPRYKRQAQYKLYIKLSRDTNDRAVVGGLQGSNRSNFGITVDKFSFCAKASSSLPIHLMSRSVLLLFNNYRVHINYRRISLRHNWSRKCHKIVKFVSITHNERNIWNDPLVATAISPEKRKPVLE